MRVLVQRVLRGSCTVDGRTSGAIEGGLVALVGAAAGDTNEDADWIARKLAGLRIFGDEEKLMNRDVRESGGAVLAIPQFTLYGDARRGRRPDFTAAARPEVAEPLFERFCMTLAGEGVRVERGVFRAHMKIELVNDGPVTLMIESPARAVPVEPGS
jgi:D-tyrosyl-tRNA(Tyr) deacylase